jgi:hypothetical protein
MMKSPSPSGHLSSVFGMLASALSITSRLVRHNWRRVGTRSDGSKDTSSARRRSPEGQATASGDPVILLALLILLGMLANRQALSLSALSCRGMYSVIEQRSRTSEQSCSIAFADKLTSIKVILKEEMGFPSEDASEDDLSDTDDLFGEDIFDPPPHDLF